LVRCKSKIEKQPGKITTLGHSKIDNTSANIGIAASGAGRWNFGCLHRCTFVRADDFQFGFLLLTSTLYFQLGSSSGLDIIKYPTCSNTCPFLQTPSSFLSSY